MSALHSRAAELDQSVEDGLEVEGRAADDLEHIGGGGLLLQRFAQLLEQSCILDSDDGLIGKIGDQLDLLVGERADLPAVDENGADELVLHEHRHTQDCPCTGSLNQRDDAWIMLEIALIFLEVEEVEDGLGAGNARKRRVLDFRWTNHRLASIPLDVIACRGTVHRDRAEGISFAQKHAAVLGPADARGVGQHGLEHRRKLAGRAGDDLEHLGSRRLPLEQFAQLVEQSCILDSDDRLIGKIADQLYLLVRERSYLGAIYGDRADELTLLEHRYAEKGSNASQLRRRHAHGIALLIGRLGRDIGNVHHLFGLHHAAEPGSRPGVYQLAHARLGISRRRAVHRYGAKPLTLPQIQGPELGAADARGVFQHGAKHRLQLASRARYHLQDLGGRGLLLERLAQLAQEPRVLDGDHCLIREGLQQADLLVSEGSDLLTTDLDVADRDVSPQQGDAEVGPVPPLPRDGAAFRELVYFCLKVQGVDQPPFHHRAAADRAPVKRDVAGRHRAVMGDEAQDASIDAVDDDVERFAQPGRAARNRIEHRLDIGRRTRDDAQNLACCRLLLQRFVQLTGALIELALQVRGGLPVHDCCVIGVPALDGIPRPHVLSDGFGPPRAVKS